MKNLVEFHPIWRRGRSLCGVPMLAGMGLFLFGQGNIPAFADYVASSSSLEGEAIVVNTTVDENNGVITGGISLREAVQYAQQHADISQVLFADELLTTSEYLSLLYKEPVYATGATIVESYGNGFVRRIDALDTSVTLRKVWEGSDNSATGALVNFKVTWPAQGAM